MPAFFSRMSDKKRGEMEREASWRKGRGWVVGGGGRWRGCWHALVSNLFESIAQFICFVSTATAEDNQTRRPLDTSYCPLMHPLPYPLSPPTPFFMWHADWRRSKGNSQASPNGGNVRKGTHIKTRLSWRYSMVQNLQSSTQDTHTHTHFYAFMYTLINTFLCGFSFPFSGRTIQLKETSLLSLCCFWVHYQSQLIIFTSIKIGNNKFNSKDSHLLKTGHIFM